MATDYEENQNYNRIVAWLHGFRYRHALQEFAAYHRAHPDKTVKVMDIGCAHAKLFELLNQTCEIDYTGIEIWMPFVEAARERYGMHDNFRVISQDAVEVLDDPELCADIVFSLETLEHIPEHQVVRLVEKVSQLQPDLFIVSAPIEIGPSIWLKNLGSALFGYNRHREYSWTETFWAGWGQLDRLPPHTDTHKGFDWRWLAQTIRHNFHIRQTRKLPFNRLPTLVSSTVYFVAQPRQASTTK